MMVAATKEFMLVILSNTARSVLSTVINGISRLRWTVRTGVWFGRSGL